MTLTPDAYPGQPLGHAANQCGHYAIGATLGLLVWPALGIAAPVAVALAYGALWEVWWKGLPDWRDGLEDTTHVLCGAGVIVLALGMGWHGAIAGQIGWGFLLAIGVRRRR